MDMLLTEDQLALAETIRDYLAGTHGPEVLCNPWTSSTR